MTGRKGFVTGVVLTVIVGALVLGIGHRAASHDVPSASAGVSHAALADLPVGLGAGSGDDYPYKDRAQDSGFDPWGEYFRECTSWVAWALHSRNGFEMPFY